MYSNPEFLSDDGSETNDFEFGKQEQNTVIKMDLTLI